MCPRACLPPDGGGAVKEVLWESQTAQCQGLPHGSCLMKSFEQVFRPGPKGGLKQPVRKLRSDRTGLPTYGATQSTSEE